MEKEKQLLQQEWLSEPLGNGLKVTFVQFLKGTPTGEVKTLEKLENVEIIRCNRATSFDYDNIPLLKETHNEMLLFCYRNSARYAYT